jgi:aspartate/methionine/tyrosine aminotransferase
MPYRLNELVLPVTEPPIPEVKTWAGQREKNIDLPLLDVSRAVPDYPPAEGLRTHLADLVMRDETSFYTDVPGMPALRAATATHLNAEYGGDLTSSHVAITAGCNQAFCLAMSALAGPGDEVILPLPYYFNYQMWLAMQGISVVPLPFDDQTGGLPDPAMAAGLVTGKTKAVVLVTPNNPTGAEYPEATLNAFYDLAEAQGIALITDETYKDFRTASGTPHTLFQRDKWEDTFIHLYSFSKVYSLTGYRVGSITCGPRLMAEVSKLMDCVAICAPQIGQHAALYGLETLSPWRAEKRQLMQDRRTALQDAFQANDLRYELVSSGAFFGYVRHPFSDMDASAVARRLAVDIGVLALPGSAFGPDQQRYLRFAFANLDANLMVELVSRLKMSQA